MMSLLGARELLPLISRLTTADPTRPEVTPDAARRHRGPRHDEPVTTESAAAAEDKGLLADLAWSFPGRAVELIGLGVLTRDEALTIQRELQRRLHGT